MKACDLARSCPASYRFHPDRFRSRRANQARMIGVIHSIALIGRIGRNGRLLF
jgi:hypothetical protein